MNLEFSEGVVKELRKLRKQDQRLLRKIKQKLKLFQENTNHPSLRLHMLSGELDNLWSISIDMSFRMICIIEDDNAYFVDIGTHEQV